MLNIDFVEDRRVVGVDGFELRFERLGGFTTIRDSDQATDGGPKFIPNNHCLGFRIGFSDQCFPVRFCKFQNSPDGGRMRPAQRYCSYNSVNMHFVLKFDLVWMAFSMRRLPYG